MMAMCGPELQPEQRQLTRLGWLEPSSFQECWQLAMLMGCGLVWWVGWVSGSSGGLGEWVSKWGLEEGRRGPLVSWEW